MKTTALLTLSLFSLALIVSPIAANAKEQSRQHQGESRKVVVNGNKNSSGNARSHSSRKQHVSHNASNSKSHKRQHKAHNNSGHKKKYHNGHKRRHYTSHKRHRKHNLGKAIIAGAALHYALGPHGRYYNGHAWCPSHYLYHTHGFSLHNDYHYTNYYNHNNYNKRRKVDTYIELDDGYCYKVTEYSNGDQKRKRIRDHHCDGIDEWDEWEE